VVSNVSDGLSWPTKNPDVTDPLKKIRALVNREARISGNPFRPQRKTPQEVVEICFREVPLTKDLHFRVFPIGPTMMFLPVEYRCLWDDHFQLCYSKLCHCRILVEWFTLQETNISHLGKRKCILKSALVRDMLVSWRVTHFMGTHFMGIPRGSNQISDIINQAMVQLGAESVWWLCLISKPSTKHKVTCHPRKLSAGKSFEPSW